MLLTCWVETLYIMSPCAVFSLPLCSINICLSYLHWLEAVPDSLSQLWVLAGDNSMSWYFDQVAGLIVVNRRSGVILAQQLVLVLFSLWKCEQQWFKGFSPPVFSFWLNLLTLLSLPRFVMLKYLFYAVPVYQLRCRIHLPQVISLSLKGLFWTSALLSSVYVSRLYF